MNRQSAKTPPTETETLDSNGEPCFTPEKRERINARTREQLRSFATGNHGPDPVSEIARILMGQPKPGEPHMCVACNAPIVSVPALEYGERTGIYRCRAGWCQQATAKITGA